MTLENPDPDREVAVQREVARVAAGRRRRVCAGGVGCDPRARHDRAADRGRRPVHHQPGRDPFGVAVDQVIEQLRGSGFEVEQTRQAPQYARLHVSTEDGLQLDVDLGVDWRQDDPVTLDVGPVLSLADAVGSKVAALYSRGEARDYLDVDAIRASGRFSDDQLVTAAAERDAGFEVGVFAQQLAVASRLQPAQVVRYGVTADQLEAVKARCVEWAAGLLSQAGSEPVAGVSSEELRGLIERRQAGFPTATTEATRRPPGPQARPAQHHHLNPDRGIEL